jgi:hypothetical protein
MIFGQSSHYYCVVFIMFDLSGILDAYVKISLGERLRILPEEAKAAFRRGDAEEINKLVQPYIESSKSIQVRWKFKHSIFSFHVSDYFDLLTALED